MRTSLRPSALASAASIVVGAVMVLVSSLTFTWASVETTGANTHGYAMVAFSITSFTPPAGGGWLTAFSLATIALALWLMARPSRPVTRTLVVTADCMAITAIASSIYAIELANHFNAAKIVHTTYNEGSFLGVSGAVLAAAAATYMLIATREPSVPLASPDEITAD